MSGAGLAGSWLIGLGAGLMTLALVRGNFGSLGFPFVLGAAGLLLLTHSGQTVAALSRHGASSGASTDCSRCCFPLARRQRPPPPDSPSLNSDASQC